MKNRARPYFFDTSKSQQTVLARKAGKLGRRGKIRWGSWHAMHIHINVRLVGSNPSRQTS
jgi:hypothetical protein